MNNFIQKIEFVADVNQVIIDLDSILKHTHWTLPSNKIHNQIGIRHRLTATDIWMDSAGSLYDKELNQFIGKESDFSEWNPQLPNYTKTLLDNLMLLENIKIGRARFMRAPPRQGLTIHRDFEIRYHLVLKTNPGALFGERVDDGEVVAKCYHIPADGHFYKVDTLRDHFIYNGGTEDRIHLVLNVL
jgi:hypothetical protein